MAAFRISVLKSLSNVRTSASGAHTFHSLATSTTFWSGRKPLPRMYLSLSMDIRGVASLAVGPYQSMRTESHQKFHYQKTDTIKRIPLAGVLSFPADLTMCSMRSVAFRRSYSSESGPVGSGSRGPDSTSISATGETNASDLGSDLIEKAKSAWQSTADVLTSTGEKAKEASNELTPYVQQLFESYPYLKDVVVPTGCTLVGTILAWAVLPSILRKFHSYAMHSKSAAAKLYGSNEPEQIPYEKSFWSALEDPMRYLVTFISLSQIGLMVAPNVIGTEYITQAWRGAAIVSVVWFLHRWKTSVFTRALASQNLTLLARNQIQTLDKVSSVGLVVLGVMAVGEACGVSVKSILTVGGVGGVATAFASRDVLGNFLSGLSMQLTQPFSIGDTIKAGSVEGQVMDMGLTNTLLLSAEKFPITVPNSMFSSQVIVNKSRAQWRAMVTKIPMQVDNLNKIPEIANAIKSMLKSNPDVSLVNEAPYCYLSYIESTYAELTIGCNLKYMGKEKFFSTQDDIILKSVNIINEHGGSLSAPSRT
uniref:Mechanosensitive ion channel MscS domain-containing protein n=1 Tax=Kalanchoe fedtschenkoi TaxID=63787 RepID=A0A7N0TWD6_KALFE